jgi:uncharacterized protein (TIGR02001 family)
MKKILTPILVALTWGAAASAMAQTAAPAAPAEPESTLAFNVGAVTDYRYRGISQSRLAPALQGGADYADKSGFYVGAWGSTIKWIQDAGAKDGNVEIDLYGGYKGAAGDVAYDVGFLRYQYQGNSYAKKNGTFPGYVDANTNEVYAAATMGLFTAKYSYATSNLFGNPNSKGSYYLDLSAALDLGDGYSLTPHLGYQNIAKTPDGTYTDYALTLGKDLGNGLSASAALIGTNAKKSFYYTPAGKATGDAGLVVGVKYTF